MSEAAWTVVRLGRGVRTELAGLYDGSGPREVGPGSRSGLFDLMIVAAEPRVLLSIRPTAWRGLLTANGMLAAVTHAHHDGSRLFDPTGALVRAGREDGLRYIDHIALLRIPVDQLGSDARVISTGAPAPRVRSHADLHVFGQAGIG